MPNSKIVTLEQVKKEIKGATKISLDQLKEKFGKSVMLDDFQKLTFHNKTFGNCQIFIFSIKGKNYQLTN